MFGAVVAVLLALPGFAENPRLSEVASYVAGEPIRAYCPQDYETWRQAISRYPFVADGFAPVGKREIYVSLNTCAVLSRPAGKATRGFSRSLLTLTHEVQHATGTRDEAEADCAALRKVAAAAITFYGFKSRSDCLRRVVAFAWEKHRSLPGQYQGVC